MFGILGAAYVGNSLNRATNRPTIKASWIDRSDPLVLKVAAEVGGMRIGDRLHVPALGFTTRGRTPTLTFMTDPSARMPTDMRSRTSRS